MAVKDDVCCWCNKDLSGCFAIMYPKREGIFREKFRKKQGVNDRNYRGNLGKYEKLKDGMKRTKRKNMGIIDKKQAKILVNNCAKYP